MPENHRQLDISTLESWLWDAACSIRGAIDAPKYKEYILPLLFYKRLPDVYADEIEPITREIGEADLARDLLDYGLCYELLHDEVPNHTLDWELLMGMHRRDWCERERRLAAWMLRERADGSG